MEKRIRIDIGPEEIAQILFEWHGKRPTRAQAQQILSKIRAEAQELLDYQVFSVVIKLSDRLPG